MQYSQKILPNRERIKQWKETKARIKEEAKVEKGQETSTEDKFKISQNSRLDSDDQQRRRISEWRSLKEMKERLKRTEIITGMNCIKIGLPGKLILSERKGLWELLFS